MDGHSASPEAPFIQGRCIVTYLKPRSRIAVVLISILGVTVATAPDALAKDRKAEARKIVTDAFGSDPNTVNAINAAITKAQNSVR